jgi:DNA-3-methyladenine glycosylase II
LGRPDILPEGDIGISRAIGQLWHLPTKPTAVRIRDRARQWAPYRFYAAELLWRSLRPASEPSDPKERALR